jgi:serine/threonine protein kinase
MEFEQKTGAEQTVTIPKCPTCGLELAGERAICACDSSLIIQPTVDPMIGKTLGCYKIVEVIGRGGMGIIYKAHDQWMDRTIAIKMLHQHLVHDPQSIQRFNQEAKAAGNIEHPNVIQAYDFGVAPDTEQPFLVMEYLQGRSLSEVIEAENRIDYERSVNIFIQACEALAAAHAKDVLHRDLKPSNIMLIQTKDQPDFVKIVDFGIAKMMPGSGKEMQLTQTGEVFGSPLYMSPEQFVGRKVDRRSDIYAMGCVMYEALMGKPPIVGEHVLETMYKHMNEKPKKFAEVRPELKISPKVEAIVLRCLEKDPDQRFQTMSELHDELNLTKAGFKDRRPFHVKMKAKLSQLKRIRKKYDELANNVLLVVLSVIIAGCLVGFALMFFRSSQESQWRALKQEAQKAYAKEDFNVAQEKFKQAAKVALESFGDEDPRYIDTLKRLAWVKDAVGDYKNGREIFKKVYKLSPEELFKIKTAQVALAPLDLLKDLRLHGTTKGPETVLRKSSETIEKFLGSNDPELIPLLEQLALIYEKENKFGEAETQYLRIFSIMRETEGDESKGAAYAHRLLGGLYDAWGKPEDAKKNWEESKKMYEKVLGPNAPEIKEVQDLLDGKKPVNPDNAVIQENPEDMHVPEL